MTSSVSRGPAQDPISAILVTFESSGVIGECLQSLARAAPRRGLDIRVVDNASSDDSAAIAAAAIGERNVLRLAENRGFAAGVNAGLAASPGRWIAILNPDTLIAEGALDRLVDVLEAHPRAGLAGPRVLDGTGHPELTVGRQPTLAREWAHAYGLDRLLGLEGRRTRFPDRLASVDWLSGCAWILRADAVRQVGPLDERYFMYYEDVDYCRRLRDRGWDVLAVPDVAVRHAIGRGSRLTRQLPVDGGAALLRYFEKFHPAAEHARARRVIERGWRLRRGFRRALARLGHRPSAALAQRFDLALRSLPPA